MMPGDDMDVITDFDTAQGGALEEIDIDFDLDEPGPQDEDLELGDFEATEDVPNLLSDPRDDLMADDEDGSFIMDEDHANLHQDSTASDFLDVDIGGSTEAFWQNNGDILAGDAPDVTENDMPSEAVVDHAETRIGGFGEQDDFNLDIFSEGDTLGEGQDPRQHHADDPEATGRGELARDEGNLKDNIVSAQSHGDDIATTPAAVNYDQGSPDVRLDTGDAAAEHEVRDQINVTGYPTTDAEPHTVGEDGENSETDGDLPVNNADGTPGSDSGLEHASAVDQVPSQPNSQQGKDEHSHSAEGEALGWEEEEEEKQEGNGLGGEAESAIPHDNHRHVDLNDSTPTQGLANDSDGSEQDAVEDWITDKEIQDDGIVPTGATVEPAEGQTFEQTLVPGTYHQVLVNYGDTEYRLFARSEDDDPNQYFLSDVRAIHSPLGEFISDLRDVIAEELSPLDELVLHIDGLGLEFGESVNSAFLQNNSFSDILAVWDMLVQNDSAEDVVDLYVYLIVRPSCIQRLAALVTQANSGRGLREVAMYRQAAHTSVATDKQTESLVPEHESLSDGVDDPVETESEQVDEASVPEDEDRRSGRSENEAANDHAREALVDEIVTIVPPFKPGKAPISFTACDLSCKATRHCPSHCQCDDCFYDRLESEWNHGQGNAQGRSGNLTDIMLFQDEEHNSDDVDNSHLVSPSGGSLSADPDTALNGADHFDYLDETNKGSTVAEGTDHHLDEADVDVATYLAAQSPVASSTVNGDDISGGDVIIGNDRHTEFSDLATGDGVASDATKPEPLGNPQVPEDEITWESDDEDAIAKQTAAANSVQVSPSSRKRDRPEADLDRDAKRHRS